MKKGFWGLFALMLLSFLGTLWLETFLQGSFTLELYFVFVGIIAGIIVLYGIASRKSWAWPLSSIFFAAGTANVLWLYYNTRTSFLSFALISIVNIVALLLSIVKAGSGRQEEEQQTTLETFEMPKYAPVYAEAGEKPAREKPSGKARGRPRAAKAVKAKRSGAKRKK